jgi:hypothetical protein
MTHCPQNKILLCIFTHFAFELDALLNCNALIKPIDFNRTVQANVKGKKGVVIALSILIGTFSSNI